MSDSVLRVWFCRHCGWKSLRPPNELPCVVCLRHGTREVRTYVDATIS